MSGIYIIEEPKIRTEEEIVTVCHYGFTKNIHATKAELNGTVINFKKIDIHSDPNDINAMFLLLLPHCFFPAQPSNSREYYNINPHNNTIITNLFREEEHIIVVDMLYLMIHKNLSTKININTKDYVSIGDCDCDTFIRVLNKNLRQIVSQTKPAFMYLSDPKPRKSRRTWLQKYDDWYQYSIEDIYRDTQYNTLGHLTDQSKKFHNMSQYCSTNIPFLMPEIADNYDTHVANLFKGYGLHVHKDLAYLFGYGNPDAVMTIIKNDLDFIVSKSTLDSINSIQTLALPDGSELTIKFECVRN